MTTPTLAISIHDTRNLGDMVCNPIDYFDIPNPQRHDAWQLGWAEDCGHNIILGGGGLVHGALAHALRFVQRNSTRKLIAWGIGHNQHGQQSTDYGSTLSFFDLVGCRDYQAAYDNGWNYVPCVSCMHPAFDQQRTTPYRRFAVYSHHERPITLHHASDMMTHWHNGLHRDAFGAVLNFLASAETVITNTYHGAYWAMLLGRRVMVYEPFSSRFYGFKWQPPFVTSESWRFTHPMTPPADFLSECRALNHDFHTRVTSLLTPLIESPTLPSSAPAGT